MAITNQTDRPVKRQLADSESLKYKRGDLYSGVYLSFDGVNDHIDVGDTSGACKTVCVWVKPTTTTETIIDFDGGTHVLEIVSGTVTATGFDTPTIYIDGHAQYTDLAAGVWSMIVVTTATSFNVSALDIGSDGVNFFDGGISNLIIFNDQRTASEIEKLWLNPGRLPTSVLLTSVVCWYPMNEDLADIGSVLDYSSNHLQGVITGATYDNNENGALLQNLSQPSVKGDYFNGSTIYLNNDDIEADFSYEDEWTLTAKIITPPDTASVYSVFQAAAASGDRVGLSIDAMGRTIFNYWDGSSYTAVSHDTTGLNEYAEIVCTMSNGTISATYNGTAFSGTNTTGLNGTTKVMIGSQTDAGSKYKGLIFSIEQAGLHRWSIFNDWEDEIGTDDMTMNGTPDEYLLTQGKALLKDAFTSSLLPYTGKYGLFRGNETARIPDNTAFDITGNISISAWVNISSIGTQMIVASRPNAYNLIVGSTGKVIFAFYQTSIKFVTGDTTLGTDIWYYISGSYDGTDTKVFINGVQDAKNSTYSGAIDSVSDYNYIGSLSNSSQYFLGLIDEVTIRDEALTTQQFLQNYRAGFAAHTN